MNTAAEKRETTRQNIEQAMNLIANADNALDNYKTSEARSLLDEAHDLLTAALKTCPATTHTERNASQ